MFYGFARMRRRDTKAWSVFAIDLSLERKPMQGIILRLEKMN